MKEVPWTQNLFTVGQLAERAGVTVSALHFYERKGLISSRRTSGNQRRYTRDTLRRIAFIRIGQRVGIPLNTLRDALAELPDRRIPSRDDWARLSNAWRDELDERIARLIQLRDDFSDCIGCGCLSIDRCQLANPYDELGREGPGPRRLLDADCTKLAEPTGERPAGQDGQPAYDCEPDCEPECEPVGARAKDGD